MKRKVLTYEQAIEKHPGCHIDLKYIRIDETYPDYENAPVAASETVSTAVIRPSLNVVFIGDSN